MVSHRLRLLMPARETGPVQMTARWVVGHDVGHHVLLCEGQVVFDKGRITFVGHGYDGEVARRIDCGNAIISPGFVDLDALSDLDTTVLGFDNQPAWKKGRIWPEDYLRNGPREMYSPDEIAWQKRYAFTRLIRNGITTALPISSLFYREWGETWDEFDSAATAAQDLGMRVYLGPAYRTGNTFVRADGAIGFHFEEERGLEGLEQAKRFCAAYEGRSDGLIRTMLAPDRIETCTPELLRRTAEAVVDLDVPVRLHCCQSAFEYQAVLSQYGQSPPEWLAGLGMLSDRAILPHVTYVSGANGITNQAPDLEIIRDHGANIAHCPLVMARHGTAMQSFSKYRNMGITIGMGTDTHPPDMIMNMQIGLMTGRLTSADAFETRAEDMFNAATIGGADALKRPDLGRLEAGACADLIVIGLNDPAMGQVIDPIQTLLLNGSGRDVRTVVIDGRFAMTDGVILGIDDDAMRRVAQTQFDGLIAQYPDRTYLHPPVDEIFSSSYPVVRGHT